MYISCLALATKQKKAHSLSPFHGGQTVLELQGKIVQNIFGMSNEKMRDCGLVNCSRSIADATSLLLL
jgi:hypothetical protein